MGVIRFFAAGPLRFFALSNNSIGWNIFDTGLVISAYAEEVVSILLSSTPSMSTMRLIRTVRLVRVFRIIRVMRFFKDLRVMVGGIWSSLQSLIWAVILLLFMMYLFGVCVLQFASQEAVEKQKLGGVLADEDFIALVEYYGSLARTVYTLYLAISGGFDWNKAATPLLALSWPLGLMFSFYIAFAVLCVLNIITGVFVENATQMTSQDDDMVLMEELETRRTWFEEVKVLFEAADTDGSGQLNAEEFSAQLQDLRMQAWFRKIGVHVESHSAEGLFQLLDFDGDGVLDLDEFAIALQSVHGPARSIDLAGVKHDVRVIRRDVDHLIGICPTFFEHTFPEMGAASRPTRRGSVLHRGRSTLAMARSTCRGTLGHVFAEQ